MDLCFLPLHLGSVPASVLAVSEPNLKKLVAANPSLGTLSLKTPPRCKEIQVSTERVT